MYKNERGEIVTILTIAAVVVMGVATVVTSALLNNKNNKQTTKTKAMEPCSCRGGSYQGPGCADEGIEPGSPCGESSSSESSSDSSPTAPDPCQDNCAQGCPGYNTPACDTNPPPNNTQTDECATPDDCNPGLGCTASCTGRPKKCNVKCPKAPAPNPGGSKPACNTCSGTTCVSSGYETDQCDYGKGCHANQDCGKTPPTTNNGNCEEIKAQGGSDYDYKVCTGLVSSTCDPCNSMGGCYNKEDCDTAKSPSYNKNTCFPAGTKVLLSNDTTKEIQNIKVGDKVISYNLTTNQPITDTVGQIFTHPYIEGGYFLLNNILKVTGNHPVWVNNTSWQEVSTLKTGDYLMDPKGDLVKIDSIRFIPGINTVYSLALNGNNHNYFTERFLVHNSAKGTGDKKTGTGSVLNRPIDCMPAGCNGSCSLAQNCKNSYGTCYYCADNAAATTDENKANTYCKDLGEPGTTKYQECMINYMPTVNDPTNLDECKKAYCPQGGCIMCGGFQAKEDYNKQLAGYNEAKSSNISCRTSCPNNDYGCYNGCDVKYPIPPIPADPEASKNARALADQAQADYEKALVQYNKDVSACVEKNKPFTCTNPAGCRPPCDLDAIKPPIKPAAVPQSADDEYKSAAAKYVSDKIKCGSDAKCLDGLTEPLSPQDYAKKQADAQKEYDKKMVQYNKDTAQYQDCGAECGWKQICMVLAGCKEPTQPAKPDITSPYSPIVVKLLGNPAGGTLPIVPPLPTETDLAQVKAKYGHPPGAGDSFKCSGQPGVLGWQGDNCDKCGYAGWWGSGCDGFILSGGQIATKANDRFLINGPLSCYATQVQAVKASCGNQVPVIITNDNANDNLNNYKVAACKDETAQACYWLAPSVINGTIQVMSDPTMTICMYNPQTKEKPTCIKPMAGQPAAAAPGVVQPAAPIAAVPPTLRVVVGDPNAPHVDPKAAVPGNSAAYNQYLLDTAFAHPNDGLIMRIDAITGNAIEFCRTYVKNGARESVENCGGPGGFKVNVEQLKKDGRCWPGACSIPIPAGAKCMKLENLNKPNSPFQNANAHAGCVFPSNN